MEQKNKWVVYAHIVPKELSGYQHNKYYIGISSNVKSRWKGNGNAYKGYKWRFIQDVKESEISDSFLLQKFNLINERLKQLQNKEV